MLFWHHKIHKIQNMADVQKYHDQSHPSHDVIILDSLLKLQLWGGGGGGTILLPSALNLFSHPAHSHSPKRAKKPGFNQV